MDINRINSLLDELQKEIDTLEYEMRIVSQEHETMSDCIYGIREQLEAQATPQAEPAGQPEARYVVRSHMGKYGLLRLADNRFIEVYATEADANAEADAMNAGERDGGS